MALEELKSDIDGIKKRDKKEHSKQPGHQQQTDRLEDLLEQEVVLKEQEARKGNFDGTHKADQKAVQSQSSGSESGESVHAGG